MSLTTSEVLKFPCEMSVKAIGKNQVDFDAHVVQIVREFCPNLSEGAVSTRTSKNSNYLSVTIKITAISRNHADNIYQALSSNPKVLMAI